MSKRLQVVLEDEEFEEIREFASGRRMSISEWVRQTLREAREREPLASAAKKLAIIEEATAHEFPTADVEQMLAEIERGRSSSAT
jgi:Arc/MetJ-type ribon-helix-helix transcriptional regulator